MSAHSESEHGTTSAPIDRVRQAKVGVDQLVSRLLHEAEHFREWPWRLQEPPVIEAFRQLITYALERGPSEEDLKKLLQAFKESAELGGLIGRHVLKTDAPNGLLRSVAYAVAELRKPAVERLMAQDPKGADLLCVIECVSESVLYPSEERSRREASLDFRMEQACYTHGQSNCRACRSMPFDEVRLSLRQTALDRFYASHPSEAELIRLVQMEMFESQALKMILDGGASDEGLCAILLHTDGGDVALQLRAAEEVLRRRHVSEGCLYRLLSSHIPGRSRTQEKEKLQGFRDLAAARLLSGSPAGYVLNAIIKASPVHADAARAKLIERGVSRNHHACMNQYGAMQDESEEWDRKNEADRDFLDAYWKAAHKGIDAAYQAKNKP